MKTLTITISDEAAENLAKAVEGGSHTAEQIAAHLVEESLDASEWWDSLSAEDRAAVEEGWAQAERGDFATEAEVNEVFDRFGQ